MRKMLIFISGNGIANLFSRFSSSEIFHGNLFSRFSQSEFFRESYDLKYLENINFREFGQNL